MSNDETPEERRARWRSVNIAASATPTRKPQVADIDAREKQWERDMPAYKRLRANGQQPKGIDGSAEWENASEPIELKMGHLFKTKEELRKAREGMQRAEDLGIANA